MTGIKSLKRIALDSNIFIYHLEQNLYYSQFTDKIFRRLGARKLHAVTNIITLTEILSYPGTDKLVEQITDSFIATPNLKIYDINLEIAVLTAKIKRDYGFRIPDSIQLATATASQVQAFITNDKRLMKYKELKIIMLSQI